MPAKHSTLNDLSAEYVRSRLDYDPATGALTWKAQPSSGGWNKRWAGKRAGDVRVGAAVVPYWRVCINGRRYFQHRVIWLWMTGEWPSGDVDHINNDPLDNRWNNLRLATRGQNHANKPVRKDSATGRKGVEPYGDRFVAYYTRAGRKRYIGIFPTLESASDAYAEKAREVWGSFARTF